MPQWLCKAGALHSPAVTSELAEPARHRPRQGLARSRAVRTPKWPCHGWPQEEGVEGQPEATAILPPSAQALAGEARQEPLACHILVIELGHPPVTFAGQAQLPPAPSTLAGL